MRNILYIVLTMAIVCACNRKESDIEEEAARMLGMARKLMNAQDYSTAKDTVLSMRKRFPMAFNARTEGIIVMDSIELLEAEDSLAVIDSMLQQEQKLLDGLKAVRSAKNEEEYTRQNLKVFHMRQHLDELGAKVKFFLRKIEIDKAELQEQKQS